MTLSTMTNNVLKYCPGLNPDLIKSNINDSYRFLCSKDWGSLKLTKPITMVIPYGTGTVSIATDGTVTGSGTTFTAAMAGRYLRAYYEDAFFEIDTVTPPTTLTLKGWTGEVVSGATYSIFQTIYPVDSLFGQVFDVIYQISLKKRSQAYFNRIDPSRITTGSSPVYWAFAGKTTLGVIQIEVYPVPSSVVSLRIYGKIKASLLGDTDSPYLPEDLIEAHSLMSCYRLKETLQPKMGWGEKEAEQSTRYQEIFDTYWEEDGELHAFHDKVKDAMGEGIYPPDDNFALSHDVD